MHGTIEGFIRFKENTGQPHLLYLVGRTKDTPYLLSLLAEAEKRGYKDAIVRTGFISENDLLSMIKGACALVFCSLAEGFGLPVAEAMSMGVPVITSTIPVLAEVAGDAALLVDPNDYDGLAHAMERIANDESLRKALVAKGYERARLYAWEKAGPEFVKVVRSLI